MVEDAESSTAGKTMPTSCLVAPSKGSSRSDDVRYMEPSAVFSSAQLAFDATENVGKSRPVAGGGDLGGGGDGSGGGGGDGASLGGHGGAGVQTLLMPVRGSKESEVRHGSSGEPYVGEVHGLSSHSAPPWQLSATSTPP